MNQARWTAKKKFMALMEKIIHDFCETHTDEEIAKADKDVQEIAERVKRRQQERKQRHDDRMRRVPKS